MECFFFGGGDSRRMGSFSSNTSLLDVHPRPLAGCILGAFPLFLCIWPSPGANLRSRLEGNKKGEFAWIWGSFLTGLRCVCVWGGRHCFFAWTSAPFPQCRTFAPLDLTLPFPLIFPFPSDLSHPRPVSSYLASSRLQPVQICKPANAQVFGSSPQQQFKNK